MSLLRDNKLLFIKMEEDLHRIEILDKTFETIAETEISNRSYLLDYGKLRSEGIEKLKKINDLDNNSN